MVRFDAVARWYGRTSLTRNEDFLANLSSLIAKTDLKEILLATALQHTDPQFGFSLTAPAGHPHPRAWLPHT